MLPTLLLCIKTHCSWQDDKGLCPCVFVVLCVNRSVNSSFWTHLPKPVCGAVKCSTTAYSSNHMSLRCHNAAQFLLIFFDIPLGAATSTLHFSVPVILSLRYSLLLWHEAQTRGPLLL